MIGWTPAADRLLYLFKVVLKRLGLGARGSMRLDSVYLIKNLSTKCLVWREHKEVIIIIVDKHALVFCVWVGIG